MKENKVLIKTRATLDHKLQFVFIYKITKTRIFCVDSHDKQIVFDRYSGYPELPYEGALLNIKLIEDYLDYLKQETYNTDIHFNEGEGFNNRVKLPIRNHGVSTGTWLQKQGFQFVRLT